DYQLVVTRAVRDLDGDALAAGQTVAFTTGESSTGPPVGIQLFPDTMLSMIVGTTYQMTATVRDGAGNTLIDQPVTWSSSDPSLVAVSPTGLLTAALRVGFARVIASAGGLTQGLNVSVTPGPPASVTVSPTPAAVAALDT